jgi:hypothetical protein
MASAEIQSKRGVDLSVEKRVLIAALPDRDTTRWVARRKADVVAAVEGGALSAQEACNRYGLSLEELVSWQRAADREGTRGLRVSMLQQNRMKHERQNRREMA